MWFITVGVIVISNLLLLVWYLHNRRKYSDINKLPGPPIHPLFGNSLEFGNNIVDIFQNSHRLIKQYGTIVRIWQSPFRVNLFITNPNYVEYFLSSNVHIKKSLGYDLYEPWLGKGLINSTGDLWKRHRRLITPAFHFKILEQFSDTFHNAGKILIKKLTEQNDKDIDIYPYIAMYAFDTICEAAMKIDVKVQTNSDLTYINATKVFLEIYILRFFSIFKRYSFLFKFTPEYKNLQDCLNTLKSFTRNAIQKRKKERENEVNDEPVINDFGIKKRKKVFIDIMLDSNQLTDEEIREETDTFLFGGHDTVSTLTAIALFVMAQHPNIQNRILEEVEEVVGTDTNKEITVKNLQDMTFIDRVIKETLRLYPSVPLIEREIKEDVVLEILSIMDVSSVVQVFLGALFCMDTTLVLILWKPFYQTYVNFLLMQNNVLRNPWQKRV